MSAVAKERVPDHLTTTDFEEWDEEVAKALATAEGVELTDEHWDVIYYLRERCRTEGPECSARQVSQALAKRYADKGGKRYLYTLFPRGPVFQASKIAGIPMPAHVVDLSFGSVY
jgi:sulfur relay protein, TusE/DsrC/DsvC family